VDRALRARFGRLAETAIKAAIAAKARNWHGLIAVFGCNFLADAIQTSPMVRITEPAQPDPELWKQIRCTEHTLKEVMCLGVFLKTSLFWQESLPVSVRPESMELIQLLLTQHLVELKKQAA
jgi:hypothetical protein